MRRLRVITWWAAWAATGLAVPPAVRASPMRDPPHPIERATPVLPDSLAGLELSGWVPVWVRVDSAGRVVHAEARDHDTSRDCFGPHAHAFEQAAIAAARGYRMAPGVGETSPAGEFVVPIPIHPPPDSSAALTGTLVGRVLEADGTGPVTKAGICLREARLATLALAYLGYRLSGIPAGSREILVSAQGYAPVRRTVVIRPGVTDTLDLRLQRCPACARIRCFDIPERGSR
jgi:hypothetical protein